MKRWMLAAAVTVMALGSVGCMSNGKSGARTSLVRSSLYSRDTIDYEKVVAVNRWAHDRGYGIEWVNLPVKTVAQKEAP